MRRGACTWISIHNLNTSAGRFIVVRLTMEGGCSRWSCTQALLVVLFVLFEHICHGSLWRRGTGILEGCHVGSTFGPPVVSRRLVRRGKTAHIAAMATAVHFPTESTSAHWSLKGSKSSVKIKN